MDSGTELTLLDTTLVQSTLVACTTLLAYDYICTLDQEVTYVWKNFQWSVGIMLFFLNRYLPFVDTIISLRLKFSMVSPETCETHFKVVSWFIVSGVIISESILLLRTFALWERKKWIAILLFVTAVAAFVPAIVVTQLEIQSLRYVQNDFPGCRISHASPIIIVAYILLMLCETMMAVLTGIKAVRHLRHSHAPWVVQLYRDGLLFYVYLTLISITNVLVPIFAPRAYANTFATPQRVMHSVLSNRVLFLIFRQRYAANMTARRPAARTPSGGALSSTLAEPIFTSFFDEQLSTNMSIVPHGLATTRTDCVSLEDYLDDGRNFGRDPDSDRGHDVSRTGVHDASSIELSGRRGRGYDSS